MKSVLRDIDSSHEKMSVLSNQLKQFKETKQGEVMSEVPSQHTRHDVMRSVLTNN